jgi:hypothetical protein
MVVDLPGARLTCRVWVLAHRWLGILRAGRLEHGDDVGGRILRIEGLHATGIGERPVGHVVIDRVLVGDDPHRAAKWHRYEDGDAAGALVGVRHQGIDERCAELSVDHIHQRRVQHRLSVELDRDVPGGGGIAAVPGEPDRVDLAGAGPLGNDAAVGGLLQAVREVAVAAGAVEARELLGLHAGGQGRQVVQVSVEIPAHRTFGR